MTKPKKPIEQIRAEKNDLAALVRKATGLYMLHGDPSQKTRRNDVLKEALRLYITEMEGRLGRADRDA